MSIFTASDKPTQQLFETLLSKASPRVMHKSANVLGSYAEGTVHASITQLKDGGYLLETTTKGHHEKNSAHHRVTFNRKGGLREMLYHRDGEPPREITAQEQRAWEILAEKIAQAAGIQRGDRSV